MYVCTLSEHTEFLIVCLDRRAFAPVGVAKIDPSLYSIPAAPRLWCDGPTQVQTPLSSSVSFRFQVGGLPEPSVVWEHEDRKIASSGRVLIETEDGITTLTITEVVRSDEGQYVCCALNGLGSVVLEAQLIVQGRAENCISLVVCCYGNKKAENCICFIVNCCIVVYLVSE